MTFAAQDEHASVCESRCGRSDDDRQVCFRNAVASDGNPARGRSPDVHQIQILFADHHETVQAFNPPWASNANLSTSTSGRGEREEVQVNEAALTLSVTPAHEVNSSALVGVGLLALLNTAWLRSRRW